MRSELPSKAMCLQSLWVVNRYIYIINIHYAHLEVTKKIHHALKENLCHLKNRIANFLLFYYLPKREKKISNLKIIIYIFPTIKRKKMINLATKIQLKDVTTLCIGGGGVGMDIWQPGLPSIRKAWLLKR